MGFKQSEVDDLLVATGRECCRCNTPHQVSVHHIVPPDEGGTDDIDNAIPLCPNCHDAVHRSLAPGQTTRAYRADELRGFRRAKIDAVARRRQGVTVPGEEGGRALAAPQPQVPEAVLGLRTESVTKVPQMTDPTGEREVAFRLELVVTNHGSETMRDPQALYWTPGPEGGPLVVPLDPEALHRGVPIPIHTAPTVSVRRLARPAVLQYACVHGRGAIRFRDSKPLGEGAALEYSCVCQVVGDGGHSPLLALRFTTRLGQDGAWGEPEVTSEEIAENDVPAHVYLR